MATVVTYCERCNRSPKGRVCWNCGWGLALKVVVACVIALPALVALLAMIAGLFISGACYPGNGVCW